MKQESLVALIPSQSHQPEGKDPSLAGAPPMYATHAYFNSNQRTDGIAAIRAIVLVTFSGGVFWCLLWKLAAFLWAVSQSARYPQ
jgi:hypothetical protein